MNADAPQGAVPDDEIARGRILASVAYLPGLCFIGLLGAPDNRYVGFHARQGFLLLLVEVAIAIAIAIYDGSIGMIPVVGFLVGSLLKFILWMSILALTIYGVVKGASGEMARIPVLGEAVEKVPF
ncbi:MAG TPA: hypothetical protein VFX78_02250 [Candidatus Eisenbacteria bacterium]|nr:hypothetical protein [Candidatus Eisenbacteria bacterium]